jgi:hypothetical protein
MARDLIGDSGLGPVSASLAPHDQPHLGGERLAQGHRLGLALAPFAPHNPTMPPDLTEPCRSRCSPCARQSRSGPRSRNPTKCRRRTRCRGGAAERHRDLLSAAGLLADDGGLKTDDAENFTIEDAIPGIPCSERYRLYLVLTDDPGQDRKPRPEERATISRYLLDELHHHVKAVTMLPGLETAENQLLTCLPFLQAQLDWDDEEEATFGG